MNPSEPSSQFGPLAPHYDELMQVVAYDEWAEYVMTLWSFAGHAPRRVLDCACGTGNVSFELAKLGLEVAGVDLSADMIQVAQQKARGQGTNNPRFFVGDLGDFDLGETFDSASCLYDSLNYILDPKHLESAFSCIARHIEPNGVFVFDMNSVHALRDDLFTQRNLDPRKALHYNWQSRFDHETRICQVEMLFQRRSENGELQEFRETHRERAYELDEVAAMLSRTGWHLLHTFDAYTLRAPHGRSERWFFVARRI